jgi:hypothetical protein
MRSCFGDNRTPARAVGALALVAACAAGGCGGGGEEEARLHAQLSILEREVEGLREVTARLEGGGAALPEEDVIVALEESVVKDLVEAQLPFGTEVDDYHVWLEHAEVRFRGSAGITLLGGVALKDRPNVSGEVRVIGALVNIAVNPETGVLQAEVAIDHLDIVDVAGVDGLLSEGIRNTLAQTIRHQIDGRLPGLTIPVQLEQKIELPSVTDGPVRIQGATMPLQASVSQVLAGQGRLWVAVHVEPGELVKTGEAPVAEAEHDGGPPPAPTGGAS